MALFLIAIDDRRHPEEARRLLPAGRLEGRMAADAALTAMLAAAHSSWSDTGQSVYDPPRTSAEAPRFRQGRGPRGGEMKFLSDEQLNALLPAESSTFPSPVP